MLFAFDDFGHMFCGIKKSTIVRTDNKVLTWLFQGKQIPPKLWNFFDQKLK